MANDGGNGLLCSGKLAVLYVGTAVTINLYSLGDKLVDHLGPRLPIQFGQLVATHSDAEQIYLCAGAADCEEKMMGQTRPTISAALHIRNATVCFAHNN